MATFDEKEFLIEDIVSSVKANISRKKDASVKYSQEMLNDFREIDDFRFKLTQKKPEEIDYEQALNFYKQIENKYKSMPDKW